MRMNDKFAALFNEPRPNPRFENWLFNTLRRRNMGVDMSHTDLRNALAECIEYSRQQQPQIVQEIQQEFRHAAVSEKLLDWVDDDQWQYCWLNRNLSMWGIHCEKTLTVREKSILSIDLMSPAVGQSKVDLVENIKKNWMRQVEKDKKYRWFFDKEKELKLSMLADWVNKNVKPVFGSLAQQADPEGQARQFYEPIDVLAFFNFEALPHTAKLCLGSIKKRWSQMQYRDGLKANQKQQCNVVLTEKSLKILDAIADQHTLSRAQILEILIRSEEKQKRYVSEWIKVAKSVE